MKTKVEIKMSSTITSNGISDFKLTTQCGQPICHRFCCKDDIIVSWVNTVLCSDECAGHITLSGQSCENRCKLTGETDNHKFCFCPCDDIEWCEHYTLDFERTCSDVSDCFSICLERFKIKVDAGSDQCILFGATATLGAGCTDPNTAYCWNGENNDDFVSDRHILNTVVRPCQPGCNKYEVAAHDIEFPECRDFDCVDVDVSTPIIVWSDIQQSDGGSTCTFSGTLISCDTYTDKFHVTLENCSTGSDIVDIYVCTPYFFTHTVQKPVVPGATHYKLTAALSDFEDCCHAVETKHFSCVRLPVTLPGGPSTFEMLIRLFGFLLLFILFGMIFNDNQ